MQPTLLPAPVELACAKGERGRLCDRSQALLELARKYGSLAAFVPGRAPAPLRQEPGERDAERDQPVRPAHRHADDDPGRRRATCTCSAPSIRLELNPGTPRARVLLDIPRWDFHWQNMYTLRTPIEAKPGDVVRVTCRYDVSHRRHGIHGVPTTPRYILWGEGTTDEMCLGLLQVTRG